MSFIVRILRLEKFEPERIVTSNVVGPKTLALIRAVEALYVWIVMISVWATSKSATGYLKYFTNLTFFGLAIYLLCSTIWSFGYLRQPQAERAQWLKNRSNWWGYLHWLLYSSIVTFHMVVPIVFWTLLNKVMGQQSAIGSWQNISVHALDGVIALSELILNRHVLEPVHSLVVAGVMLCYMLMTFIVYANEGTWVYPFLNWSNGAFAAVYYIGIAVGLFVIFFLLLAVHKYRNQWLARRCAVVNPELTQTMTPAHAKDIEAGEKMEYVETGEKEQ